MTRPSAWRTIDFEQCLDEWIELEQPGDDLRLLVTRWLLSRIDDPYVDARREPGFDNLWWAWIPGSIHVGPQMVGCSFWIHETERTVRCDHIASLSSPA